MTSTSRISGVALVAASKTTSRNPTEEYLRNMKVFGIGDVEVGEHCGDIQILALANGENRTLLCFGRRDPFPIAIGDGGDAVGGGNAVAWLGVHCGWNRLVLDDRGLTGRGNLGIDALIEAGVELSQLRLNLSGVGTVDFDFHARRI